MSTSHRKIRWGVLGYARIARLELIPAIKRASNAEFFAVASRDAGKLAECRAQHGCPHSYESYDELLQDPQIDAVYIPLPNSLHREWTLRAVAAGKHVLCEKPIALNAGECREMIAAAEKHKVLLMEAFMYRYNERSRLVLETLRSGVLGEIKFIHSSFRFLLNRPGDVRLLPELGGGSLYDVGCYPVNFTGMVVDEAARQQGAPTGSYALPEVVSAQAVRNAAGVDVLFSALLKYSPGVIASIHSGFNAQKRVYSEIVGTKGSLEIPDTFFDNAGVLTLTTGEEKREIPVAVSDRYRAEIEDFSGAILEKRAPLFSMTETLRNAQVLDLLLAAIR